MFSTLFPYFVQILLFSFSGNEARVTGRLLHFFIIFERSLIEILSFCTRLFVYIVSKSCLNEDETLVTGVVVNFSLLRTFSQLKTLLP